MEHTFWHRRHLTRALNIYKVPTQSERHPRKRKTHTVRNSKYKIASTELVMDSRRGKDWNIRLEAKIKGLT